jgi:holo-[acyl-carrier protein] synthase
MSIRVGTDIVSVSRVKKSIDKFGNKFLNRFLTSSEISRAKKIESIAGLWAAKEAISKALGCGIGKELNFKDIEIYKDSKGAPHFKIKNSNFNIVDSSLSISHDKDFAIAVVIINYL